MPEIDHNRRKFIKLLAVGVGVGIVGKLFGSDILNLFGGGGQSIDANSSTNFKIKEGEEGLSVYSKSGEELFVIDNGE